MGDIGAIANLGFLDFHKIPHAAAFANIRSPSEMSEGSDPATGFDSAIGNHRVLHRHVFANLTVFDRASGTDVTSRTNRRLAPQVSLGFDDGIGFHVYRIVDGDAIGIDEGDPSTHQFVFDPRLQNLVRLGQLLAAVHAKNFLRIGSIDHRYRIEIIDCIGEIVFCLVVIGLELRQNCL